MRSVDLLIDRQIRGWEMDRVATGQAGTTEPPAHRPVVTVSRQHGTHGLAIAAEMAQQLGYTLLHREIIDRMCASTGCSRRLLEALDERTRSQIASWIDAMLEGRYVDNSDYVRALCTTTRSVAELGGAVIVGRGANHIVGPAGGFHVRVVAPRQVRIHTLMERKRISRREAVHELETRDRERVEFIRKVFGRSVDDPLAFDVVLNEQGTRPQEIASWLVVAARNKFQRLRGAHPGHDPIGSWQAQPAEISK